ncbi:MAG: Radical SAM domain protein [Proteiniphilum acetatigenes]|jgi:MoaA/NifB/PqqE/SkfB family radical SAM enzyme|uniref:Radical SAM domain protein n=1 Tax=Proteiniphilum acetatigenes TaxID=294710 RepID=A0A101HKG4_9BACT|nr:MAG: Radical SAM domain protein [Proteiniphilum acetatigenes]HCC85305.1 radical SAM protein [Porphyromonadaceae bacterium]
MKQNLGSSLASFGLKQAFSYLESNPQKNMPQLIKWAEKFDWKGNYSREIRGVKKSLSDPDNNWNIFVNKFWELDPGIRKKTFENFFVNGVFRARNKLDESRARYQCNVPWAILMDPTSACNLRCTGCWAADYGNKMNMSYETLDDIIRQGKELGTYFYIFSGGEPLIRKKDIIRLCEKHNDCMFLAFTNATLIDEAFANEMLRVKNFIPAISLEGFEKETDSRRGEGTFKAVEKAMDILHSKKLLFGVSCTYTRANTEVIGSEKYFDFMIDKGAMFAWFFTYMPVGVNAVPELLATPEQRKFMYQQIRKFRRSKPLFTMDFWNDGEYVNGCIAGGRNYLHINANGDIEPCAFIHYSDSNIHETTLLEAYQSPLFMQYKQNQPFSENMLRPCPLLDHEHKLAEMVDKTEAISTDLEHPEDVDDLCAKTVNAAKNWKPVADELWRQAPSPN